MVLRSKSAKSAKGKKSKKASSSFLYNPVDPMNQYPNYKTGEEEYGPPPPFGYNEHDPLNMQPFNPNAMSAMFGGAMVHPPQVGPSPVSYTQGLMGPLMPPPFNMLGMPNPIAPIAAPMTPTVPSTAYGMPSLFPPMQQGPAALPSLPAPGSYSAFPYGYGSVGPQVSNASDPNNQFPHPLTGSHTEPGPALAGGMNAYDPYNVIGAPVPANEDQRVQMHNRMAMQAQHPQAPYHMTPIKKRGRK